MVKLSVIVCTLIFGACSKEREIKVGEYYFEGSDSVYNEGLPNNKITFVGVDFTADFERWESYGTNIFDIENN